MAHVTETHAADTSLGKIADRRRSPILISVLASIPAYRLGLIAALEGAGMTCLSMDDFRRCCGNGQRGVLVAVANDSDEIKRFDEIRKVLGQTTVVLVRSTDPDIYRRLVAAGFPYAAGHDAAITTIVMTIEAAVQGYALVTEELLVDLVNDNAVSARNGAPALSQDERQWIQMLAEGVTVGVLASNVGYSEREMYRNLKRLYRQLGASNRTRAIINAVRYGLVS